jgi:hypothetical protein
MPQHLRRLRQIAGRIHQIGPEGVAGRVQHQILGPALRAAEGTRGLEARSGCLRDALESLWDSVWSYQAQIALESLR